VCGGVRYIRCKKNLIEGLMKSIFIAFVCFVCATLTSAEAVGTKYNIAHTRSRNADMVIIKVGPRFFEADLKTQARWYTDMQACVRGVKLAGTVVVVSTLNGRFKFYGPTSWHDFLRTIDMPWVNARVNKEMTCRF
jgi:hypothetical protein